jgi:hypothetical protein
MARETGSGISQKIFEALKNMRCPGKWLMDHKVTRYAPTLVRTRPAFVVLAYAPPPSPASCIRASHRAGITARPIAPIVTDVAGNRRKSPLYASIETLDSGCQAYQFERSGSRGVVTRYPRRFLEVVFTCFVLKPSIPGIVSRLSRTAKARGSPRRRSARAIRSMSSG